jgi:hypothetical protein
MITSPTGIATDCRWLGSSGRSAASLSVRRATSFASRLWDRAGFLSFIVSSAREVLHCLMEIKARILDCPESEEHIVRRLGKAAVVLWDTLPAPVQDQILKQAALMHDRERTLQLRQRIKAFIKQWKVIE